MTVPTFPPTGPGIAAAAIVLAAGSGTRVGAGHNKVFLPLAGRRVVSWSLGSFARVSAVRRFVMVIRDADRELAQQTIDRETPDIPVEIIVGGQTRQQSELAALRHLAPAIDAGEITMVLIHDGARPLLSPALIQTLIGATALHQAAFPAIEKHDVRRSRPDGTIDMSWPGRLIAAQTPQTFRARTLLDAYEQAEVDGFNGTDTVSCWQRYSTVPVHWVPGDPRNLKITYPGDLSDAEKLLQESNFQLD